MTEIEKLELAVSEIQQQLQEVVYYEEVQHAQYRDEISKTDYILTHIPHLDKNGQIIKLQHGYQNDLINSGVGESVRSFANRNQTSFAANASVFSTSSGLVIGNQIQDGKILKNSPSATNYTLGVKGDNTLVSYPPGISATTILADGCIQAFTGFFPMIEDGSPVNPSVYASVPNTAEKHTRQVVAQMPNKDLVFMTVEGRTKENAGMSYADMIRVLSERGVVFAYCLDGGGSAQSVVRGMLVNSPIDNNGKKERLVADYLYVKKPSTHPEGLKTTNADLGDLNKKLSDLKRDLYDKKDIYPGYVALRGDDAYTSHGIESWQGDTKKTKLNLGLDALSYVSFLKQLPIFQVNEQGDLSTQKGKIGMVLDIAKNVPDLNELKETGFYWAGANTLQRPSTDFTWGIIHFQAGSSAAMQVAIPFHSTLGTLKMRRTITSGWGEWRDI